nr:hypothetical protein [Lachnospiraceae bacterium]
FVARLSGSTAEFLQMWELMMFGEKLFSVENGELTLTLSPAIPSYLVPEDGRVSATLFGTTEVVYEAGNSRDLIPGAYKVTAYEITCADGSVEKIQAPCLVGEAAKKVRDGKVKKLTVTLQ